MRNINLALCRSRLVVLDRAEVNIDKRDAGEHQHDDGHPDAVLYAHRGQYALIAFIGPFSTCFEPFLDNNGYKGNGEHAAGDQHRPDAVVDDPGNQRHVILQVVGSEKRHVPGLPLDRLHQQAGLQCDDRDEAGDLGT